MANIFRFFFFIMNITRQSLSLYQHFFHDFLNVYCLNKLRFSYGVIKLLNHEEFLDSLH